MDEEKEEKVVDIICNIHVEWKVDIYPPGEEREQYLEAMEKVFNGRVREIMSSSQQNL